MTPYGKPIRSGILKGIRDWGIDVIAGGISLAAHDTIKKVEPTANADASFFLNWFGTSSIPSMMMGYNKVGIQSVDYVQSIARENALELNTGHARLGSSATPFLDEVTVDGILSLATMGAMNALTKGAQLSRRIGQEISESTIDVVQRIDDDVAQVIAKAGKSLDTADAVPLEKLEEVAPNSVHYDPNLVAGPNPNGLRQRAVTSPTAGEGGVYLKPHGGRTKIGSTGDFEGRYGPNAKPGIEVEIPQTRSGPPAGVDDSAYPWSGEYQRRFDEEYLDRLTPADVRYRAPNKPQSPVSQRKWELYRHIFGYGDVPADFGY